MKILPFVLGFAALLSPALMAQVASPKAPEISTLYTRLEREVSQIKEKGELARWQSNLDLWKSVRDAKGGFSPERIAAMDKSLAAIRKVVSGIKEKGELERWQANVNLWSGFRASRTTPPHARANSSGADLKTMKRNVGTLAGSDEKRRWTINLDLWMLILGQK